VVPESLVTRATSVPILVFLYLSVLDFGPMYATDRQTDVVVVRRASSLNASALSGRRNNKQAVREAATICPAPVTLTFDLLTLKVMSESHVMWATSAPILVFLGLSVLDLGPMYATDRRQADRQMLDRCQTSDSITA